jgi:hypothetical protein
LLKVPWVSQDWALLRRPLEERKATVGAEAMTATMIVVHDVHDLAEVVVSLQKARRSFNRQQRPPFWLVLLKLSVSEMNLEDGEETRASVSLRRLLEPVVSMQRQTMIPITRASVTFLRLW